MTLVAGQGRAGQGRSEHVQEGEGGAQSDLTLVAGQGRSEHVQEGEGWSSKTRLESVNT